MEKGNWCPFSKGKCKKEECKFWIHLLGKNPQGTETIDKFDCAISFLPILLVENAQMSRHITATVESFRNVIADPKGTLGVLAFHLDRFGSIIAGRKPQLREGAEGDQTP